MKATLLLTTSCNLRCSYCYIARGSHSMSPARLVQAVDFAFQHVSPDDRLDFGLFGGEPLMKPSLVQQAVALIEERAQVRKNDVRLSLVTNGTLLNAETLGLLRDHNVILQVSCDGLPQVHDRYRRFPEGHGSSAVVMENIAAALDSLPAVLVNLVYRPDTYDRLPESLAFLASHGLKQIVLNPDYAATWRPEDIAGLRNTYMQVADLYLEYYRSDSPLFISLIDEKIAVILRGGYGPAERCHMGVNELAFSPQGYIYPCERLAGNGDYNQHCIGHLDRPDQLDLNRCPSAGNSSKRMECQLCGVSDFCMNWCGCSNYMANGDYRLPSHFICTSERHAIEAAQKVLNGVAHDDQLVFIHHYAGLPMVNSSRELTH